MHPGTRAVTSKGVPLKHHSPDSSNKDGGVEAKAVIPRTTELANSLRSCRAGYRVAGDCSSVNAARQLKWALFHHSVLSRLLSAARSQTSAARAPAPPHGQCVMQRTGSGAYRRICGAGQACLRMGGVGVRGLVCSGRRQGGPQGGEGADSTCVSVAWYFSCCLNWEAACARAGGEVPWYFSWSLKCDFARSSLRCELARASGGGGTGTRGRIGT